MGPTMESESQPHSLQPCACLEPASQNITFRTSKRHFDAPHRSSLRPTRELGLSEISANIIEVADNGNKGHVPTAQGAPTWPVGAATVIQTSLISTHSVPTYEAWFEQPTSLAYIL